MPMLAYAHFRAWAICAYTKRTQSGSDLSVFLKLLRLGVELGKDKNP